MVFGVIIILVLFAGIVSTFLLPLPVLVYRLKLGRTKGATVAAIAFAAITVILAGDVMGIFLFLALLSLGFALGESFEKRFSLEKTMLVACGTPVVIAVLAVVFYSFSTGVGIRELISGYVDGNIALYKAAFDQLNVAAETRQAFNEQIDWFGKNILRPGLPGITVSGFLSTAWVTLLLARPLLKRMRLTFPDFGSLNRWQVPEMLVWVLIGCGLLLIIPSGGLRLIGLNGLWVVLQVYFLQGIAIVSFFFVKQSIPPILRGILYFFIFTQPLLILLTGLSIFDMWLNVRRLGVENATPRE